MAEDEFTVDFSNIATATKNGFQHTKTFLSGKTGQALIVTFLILVAVFAGFFVRNGPITLQPLEDAAERNVRNSVIQGLTQQIQAQNPNAPSSAAQRQAQQRYPSYYEANQAEIDSRIDDVASQYKGYYSNDDGYPYLIAIDPYFYWRQTENYLENGHVGDELRNGKPYDTASLAPNGRFVTQELHPVLAGTLYNFASGLGIVDNPYVVFFSLPAFIAALAAIPGFFLGKKYGGNFGGFTASILIVTHQLFVNRSVAGFSDTDAYNITLPLFVFWFTVEAFQATTWKKRGAYGVLSAASLGLLAYAWTAWWLTGVFLVVTSIAAVIHAFGQRIVEGVQSGGAAFKNIWTEHVNNTLALGLSLPVLGLLAAGITRGVTNAFSLLTSALGRTGIQNAAKETLWPNVFTTVAELNAASFTRVTDSLGGTTLFTLALIGALFTFLPKEFKDTTERKVYYSWLAGSIFMFLLAPSFGGRVWTLVGFAIPIIAGYFITMWDSTVRNITFPVFLTSWFIALVYASLNGVRFTMILLPAYAIGLGTFFGYLFQRTKQYYADAEEQSTRGIAVTMGLILLIGTAFIVLPTVQAGSQAENRVPGMNDAWNNALTTITEETPEDTIITSWWDFGHWFKAVADRRVTFDGASQNTPAAHWVGRALSTSNEAEATGIMRMLNCGNADGYDALLEVYGEDTAENRVRVKQILDEAILADRTEATALYEDAGLSGEEARNVADLTHCEAPPTAFITSSDMVGKAGVWAHFGTWTFERAYSVAEYNPQRPQQTVENYESVLGLSPEEAQQRSEEVSRLQTEDERNRWISGYPSYVTRSAVMCQENNGTVTCPVQFTVQQTQQEVLQAEQITFNADDPSESEVVIGQYDRQNQFRVGQLSGSIREITVAENGDEETYDVPETENQFNLAMYVTNQNGTYRAVVASPELASSVFTKLYYFNGAGTEAFDLLIDEQGTFSGERIKVWTLEY